MRDYEEERKRFLKNLEEKMEVIQDMSEKENYSDLVQYKQHEDGDFFIGVCVYKRFLKELTERGINNYF